MQAPIRHDIEVVGVLLVQEFCLLIFVCCGGGWWWWLLVVVVFVLF